MAQTRRTLPGASCPGPAQLFALLADNLPADESALLGTHVETCESCQQTLDELTAVQQLWSDPAEETERPIEPGLRRVMDDLRNYPSLPGDAGPTGSGCDAAESTDQLGRLAHYDVLALIGRGGTGVVL